MRRILVVAAALALLLVLALAWRMREPERGAGPTAPVAAAGEPNAAAAPLTALVRPSRRTEAAPAPPPADEGALAARPDGITILLLDAAGKPLPGKGLAVYWLEEGRELVVEGRTDASGSLATPIAAPDLLEGMVLEDSALHAYGPFESAPDRPDVVVVRCPGFARLEGVVRDETGQAVAGALVEIEPQPVLGLDPYVGSFVVERRDAETDAYGRFEVALAEGCFALAPAAEGFDAAEVALPCLAAGTATIVDLVLQGSDRKVEVEVRANGKRLSEPVLVTPTRAADPPPTSGILRDRFAIERKSESAGESVYLARLSRDGDWSVTVTLARGYADALRVPIGPADDRIVVDLRKPEPPRGAAWIRGTVSTQAGRPVSAEVVLFHGVNLDYATIVRSDVAGAFAIEIDPREPGPLFLLAREEGHGAAGAGPIEPARPPTSIDLVLGSERRITGVVAGPDGVGVPARLSLQPARTFFTPLLPTGGPPPEGFFDEAVGAETDEEGAFSFRGLSEGAYEIRARAKDPDLGLPPACVVAQAGDGELSIVLGAGLERYATLAGTVRESGTGRPIAGARVAAGLVRGGAFRSEDSFTGEDGRYFLRGCPAEPLEVFVDAPGCAYLRLDAGPYPPGEHALDLEVLPERTLRLLVVDSSGTPVAGVYVSAADASGKPILLRNGDDVLVTDLAGRVDLRGLPAAEVLVTAGRRGEEHRFVANAAYQAPDAAQPQAREQRFDLRIPLAGVPRIVLER